MTDHDDSFATVLQMMPGGAAPTIRPVGHALAAVGQLVNGITSAGERPSSSGGPTTDALYAAPTGQLPAWPQSLIKLLTSGRVSELQPLPAAAAAPAAPPQLQPMGLPPLATPDMQLHPPHRPLKRRLQVMDALVLPQAVFCEIDNRGLESVVMSKVAGNAADMLVGNPGDARGSLDPSSHAPVPVVPVLVPFQVLCDAEGTPLQTQPGTHRLIKRMKLLHEEFAARPSAHERNSQRPAARPGLAAQARPHAIPAHAPDGPLPEHTPIPPTPFGAGDVPAGTSQPSPACTFAAASSAAADTAAAAAGSWSPGEIAVQQLLAALSTAAATIATPPTAVSDYSDRGLAGVMSQPSGWPAALPNMSGPGLAVPPPAPPAVSSWSSGPADGCFECS